MARPPTEHDGDLDLDGSVENDPIAIRNLREGDLPRIVEIDGAVMGRLRHEYYRDKVAASLRDSRIRLSLVAELEGKVVGFLMGTMHYGEFGRPEPSAVIDSIGVAAECRGRKVGRALMRQFLAHARALGVEQVRTEVAWDDLDLIRFLSGFGYAPAGRTVLELRL